MVVRRVKITLIVIACVTLTTATVPAADYYFSTSINQLKFVEGKLPRGHDPAESRILWNRMEAMVPQVRLADGGEAYVSGFEPFGGETRRDDSDVAPRGPQLLVHTTASKDVVGWLYWPKTDYSGYVKLKFVLPKLQDLLLSSYS